MNFNRVKLVFAAKSFCPPHWKWSNSGRSGLLNLWYVATGLGNLEQEERRFELNEGTCLLLREWIPHVATHSPSHPLTVPYVQFQLLNDKGEVRKPEESEIPKQYRVLPERTMLAGMMDRCVDAWNRNDRESAEHWLISCLRELELQDTIGQWESESHQRTIVGNAAALIEEHPERSWRVSQMARMAGYSTDHFIRLFKKFQGTTPGDYHVRCRIAAAMNMLRFSDDSISDIADYLGYPDIYCFSKQFSKVMGRSPRSFRQ